MNGKEILDEFESLSDEARSIQIVLCGVYEQIGMLTWQATRMPEVMQRISTLQKRIHKLSGAYVGEYVQRAGEHSHNMALAAMAGAVIAHKTLDKRPPDVVE